MNKPTYVDSIYKQNLYEDIIKYLAKVKNIDLRVPKQRVYKSFSQKILPPIQNYVLGNWLF